MGSSWQPLGIPAAIGFTILMACAVDFLARFGDYTNPATRRKAMAHIALMTLSVATAMTLGPAM
ncbi:hypothetical protein [Streptomyces sp. NPDC058335]|uniref:hypothetical protein n=1 Tax=Streptomyces sp. NPDC058335 TaxID=3346451 RepID=UPI00364635B0